MNKSPVSIGADLRAGRLVMLVVIALSALTACGSGGGGGGGGSASGSSGPPPAADPCSSANGIEGGGRQIFSGLVATAAAGGQVTVSSVRFAASSAKVVVDGAPASTENLLPGNVATLTGAVDFKLRTGCAAAAYADANVIGAIDAVYADHRTLVVLGQPISVDDGTVFGGDLQPSGLSSLQIGDRIRVSGLRADSSIVATRIDRDPGTDGFYVAGPVSELDTVNRAFRIDEIQIRYDAASLAGFPDGEPQTGDIVRVSGTIVGLDDSSSTGAIVLQAAQVELIAYGVPLEISPATASVPRGGTRQFDISKGTGPVTWSVSDGHGGACSAQNCGVIDSTGHYVAPTSTSTSDLLITAASIVDPAVTASAVVVVDQGAPFLPGGPHTVSGEIVSAETGPVPGDVNVSLWVEKKNGDGYSYSWANGPLVAHDGFFQAPNIPDSYVTLKAGTPGYAQPCVAGAAVHGDVTVHIELQPESAFASTNAPRPMQSAEPSLSGIIYEMTDTGRQPVAGAKVWFETFMDVVAATTLSDAGGGYYLCNLGAVATPSYPEVLVTKQGYATTEVYPIPIGDRAPMDIELKRL